MAEATTATLHNEETIHRLSLQWKNPKEASRIHKKVLQPLLDDRQKKSRKNIDGNKKRSVSFQVAVFLKLWGAWIIYHAASSGSIVAFASTLPPLEKDDECGLYLAPSTIPGAGLGVFAGRNIAQGAILGGDICVPIVDLSWHDRRNRQHSKQLHGLEEYLLEGFSIGMATESERGDVQALCFGLDSLVRGGNTPNIGPSSLEYDDSGYHRSSSVAAGAFTPYFNRTSIASASIRVGEELFKDYGSLLDQDRPSLTDARSLEWLRSNGACLDNIRPGFSSLPRAGHGAFASRRITAGSVVTVSPLYVLSDDSFVRMYNFLPRMHGESSKSNQGLYRLVDEGQTSQLLLNYCFGGTSTPLLCPLGAGVSLINHNKLQTNIRVQWATDFPSLHNHSFVPSGSQYDQEPQIAFQYVALKDIQKGEELFMDYGDDWVAAWVKHAVDYAMSDEHYISSHSYNKMFADLPLRTEEQVKFDPYPSNLQLRCHRALLTQPRDMNATYYWSNDVGYPCTVIDYFVEFGQELYTIALDVAIDDANDGDKLQRIHLTDIPRSAVQFFDRPYTTDIHQTTAFRQAIKLPKDVSASFSFGRQRHPL